MSAKQLGSATRDIGLRIQPAAGRTADARADEGGEARRAAKEVLRASAEFSSQYQKLRANVKKFLNAMRGVR